MRDEYPKRAFLTASQVRTLIGIENHKEWLAFLAEHPTFPTLVAVGKTAKGTPRLRYSKARIYAFLELLGA